jgi:catechol 2,3-dioxygenase-like lactoylglutathione lyase family enzyme
MNPIEINAIDHVVLRVKDLAAALAFYRDALGLVIERELDIGLVQLRAGASLIDLVPVSSPLGSAGGPAAASTGHNMDHFALELTRFDADAIFTHLDTHGVVHGDVAQRYGAKGSGPSIYLKDPDGNTVELKGAATDPRTSRV